MYDVVSLGELLIDFTECGYSKAGMKLFERNPGGAVANVLTVIARFGGKAGFIGKVGDDMHGRFLLETLKSVGIDPAGLVTEPDAFTTLAFVELTAEGDRSFSFARKPGADTRLRIDEVNMEMLRNTRAFHIGSLSLTDEPARTATLLAVQAAAAAGAIISYDPNYRPSLWKAPEAAKAQMLEPLPWVDFLKLSQEEAELLSGEREPEDAAKWFYAKGVPCAAVTAGGGGAYLCLNGETAKIPAFTVDAVDTTGAGDAFTGGFLFHMLGLGKAFDKMSIAEGVECAVWGNAAAACCVQKRGAIPAMPEYESALRYVRQIYA